MVDNIPGPDVLRAFLRRFPQSKNCRLAYSGGMDSHVLLHLVHALQGQTGISLTAVHVNHGLQVDAGEWASHCQRVCDAMNIELLIRQVDARAPAGMSPEAYARKCRYDQFKVLMQADDLLLTAHHMDDQAETLLLQLLRGAGPAGLAAMPADKTFGPGWHGRPLLDFSRDSIRAYALAHELDWIEDTSNQDTGPDRNYIRHRVLPVLRERWPATTTILSRVASHLSTARELLGILAAEDYRQVRTEDSHRLVIEPLLKLGEQRALNCLKYWLDLNQAPIPGSVHLAGLYHEVIKSREDSEACVHWSGVEVRRYRDILYLLHSQAAYNPESRIAWNIREPCRIPTGTITATRVTGRGIRVQQVPDEQLEIRFRRGGEKIRPAGDAHTRDLKKLFQQQGVAPWLRDRMPLIYRDNHLVAVPGVCVAEGYAAGEQEPGWDVVWQSEA